MAAYNGTRLVPRPIHQSGSSPSPLFGSKNPYSYCYLGKKYIQNVAWPGDFWSIHRCVIPARYDWGKSLNVTTCTVRLRSLHALVPGSILLGHFFEGHFLKSRFFFWKLRKFFKICGSWSWSFLKNLPLDLLWVFLSQILGPFFSVRILLKKPGEVSQAWGMFWRSTIEQYHEDDMWDPAHVATWRATWNKPCMELRGGRWWKSWFCIKVGAEGGQNWPD